MQENDETLALAADDVDLSWDGEPGAMLCFLLFALQSGCMVINERNEEIAVAFWDD